MRRHDFVVLRSVSNTGPLDPSGRSAAADASAGLAFKFKAAGIYMWFQVLLVTVPLFVALMLGALGGAAAFAK